MALGAPTGPSETFHRRPLPEGLVDFGSAEGRALLAEALGAGTAEAFFPLVAHLHTQAEPAWCGLGTLVTVLNALEIDPGRVWKGPWRYFGEELLQCCKSLELASAEGLTLAEVGCLAACNGAAVTVRHAVDAEELSTARRYRGRDPARRSRAKSRGRGTRAPRGREEAFRGALLASVRASAGPFLVANYARGALGQTGDGHFSPLAAWHEARDLVLVLDVARFKYPPHWVPVRALWGAMSVLDAATGAARGWLEVGRAQGVVRPPAELPAFLDRLQRLGGGCPVPPT